MTAAHQLAEFAVGLQYGQIPVRQLAEAKKVADFGQLDVAL
jgi:hypothetical protein